MMDFCMAYYNNVRGMCLSFDEHGNVIEVLSTSDISDGASYNEIMQSYQHGVLESVALSDFREALILGVRVEPKVYGNVFEFKDFLDILRTIDEEHVLHLNGGRHNLSGINMVLEKGWFETREYEFEIDCSYDTDIMISGTDCYINNENDRDFGIDLNLTCNETLTCSLDNMKFGILFYEGKNLNIGLNNVSVGDANFTCKDISFTAENSGFRGLTFDCVNIDITMPESRYDNDILIQSYDNCFEKVHINAADISTLSIMTHQLTNVEFDIRIKALAKLTVVTQKQCMYDGTVWFSSILKGIGSVERIHILLADADEEDFKVLRERYGALVPDGCKLSITQ